MLTIFCNTVLLQNNFLNTAKTMCRKVFDTQQYPWLLIWSRHLHENLASPLFKCSLEITNHILRAFFWFLESLTFYFANHASVKKSFMYRFHNDVVTSGLRHCHFSITDTVSPKCTGVSYTFKTFSQALRVWHRTIWVTLSWCHVSQHHGAT